MALAIMPDHKLLSHLDVVAAKFSPLRLALVKAIMIMARPRFIGVLR